MTHEKNELEKQVDRLNIKMQDLNLQLEAKEDLIATLEESLEESKFQIKCLSTKLNIDGEKYQSEVKNLMDKNNEFKSKTEELEKKVHEARETYIASKLNQQYPEVTE